MSKSNLCISVTNLSISYDSISVLSCLNFSIKVGKVVAIVGESGTGKTSILNAIANFIPFQGDILVTGKIGYIFQNYGVFPWMTVQDNIAFGAKRKNSSNYVLEILRKVGLEPLRNKYPNQLSGGQVQRVAIARTLAMNPDIILADEPYGSLDYHTRNRMQEWLLEILRSTSKTVIIVTHNVPEAIYLSDRVLVLGKGGIKCDLSIPLARPRSPGMKFESEFNNLERRILQQL